VERKLYTGQNTPRVVAPVEEEIEVEEGEEKKKMKVRNWREKCKDTRQWNEILKQVKTHQELLHRLKKKKKEKKKGISEKLEREV
jgi:hypothetical protein